MGFLRDLTKTIRKIDPVTDYAAKYTADAPGTPGSLIAAVESDAPSGNLYGKKASKSDIFAGGAALSEEEDNRAIGRAIGSFYAGYGIGAGVGGVTGKLASTAIIGVAKGLDAESSNGIQPAGFLSRFENPLPANDPTARYLDSTTDDPFAEFTAPDKVWIWLVALGLLLFFLTLGKR